MVANAVVGMLSEDAASCSFDTMALLDEEGLLVNDADEGCIEEAVGASDIAELAIETELALGSDPNPCGLHKP